MQSRPFLQFWDHLEVMELKRRKGLIPDCRYLMTLAFVEVITPACFLQEAR